MLQRAQAWGHAASEREIRAIHFASMGNLRAAIASFDLVRAYNSTARWVPPRVAATARNGRLELHDPRPAWLAAALAPTEG